MSVTGSEQVVANLNAYLARMQANAEIAMGEVMAALEGWAKSEHPYTDRTANNTNSIRGEVAEASATLVRGVLTAGMDYSVFLELAHEGKWAFLWPVIERHKDEVMAMIERRMRA